VKAVLRRKNQSGKDEEIRFGDVSVNFVTREVYRGGAPVEFTQKEFELLTYLIRRPGEAVSREKIFEDIWGQSSGNGTRNIDNFILRIRKKLEADPAHHSHFMTIYGFGYKFLPGDS
jgi:two-component system alkaline phosphatase synthesis response regulator PhoP